MKVAYGSDLHLEFAPLKEDLVLPQADILVLAGDVGVVSKFTKEPRYLEFFKRVSQTYPTVLFVLGNHEHYKGDFSKTTSRAREFLSENALNNVVLLDKESFETENAVFVGATLWTDFHKDTLAYNVARNTMNCWRAAKNSKDPSWKFLPKHSLADHHGALNAYKKAQELSVRTSKPLVVVSHHAPSEQSAWAYNNVDRGKYGAYYYSHLEEFVKSLDSATYWVHGHIHDKSQYLLGKCQVLCNPRGYPDKKQTCEQWTNWNFEVFEV